MGLADELLPRLNVSRNIRHVSADGKLLLLITRSGVGPEGWNNAYRFYQPEFEAVLRARRVALSVGRRAAAQRGIRARRSRRSRPRPLRKSRSRRACRSHRPLCRRLRRRALDGQALHGRGAAGPALARALDRARHDPRSAAGRRAGSGRRNRPRHRRDPVLRSGAADDFHSDARQAPSLGIHADAAGRSGDDHPAGTHLRAAKAVEHRSGEIHDRTRGRLHLPFRAFDAMAARPAAARRRCRASDAAVPRAGHVLRACATPPIWRGSCAT